MTSKTTHLKELIVMVTDMVTIQTEVTQMHSLTILTNGEMVMVTGMEITLMNSL